MERCGQLANLRAIVDVGNRKTARHPEALAFREELKFGLVGQRLHGFDRRQADAVHGLDFGARRRYGVDALVAGQNQDGSRRELRAEFDQRLDEWGTCETRRAHESAISRPAGRPLPRCFDDKQWHVPLAETASHAQTDQGSANYDCREYSNAFCSVRCLRFEAPALQLRYKAVLPIVARPHPA